ncbi:hypothetical protein [Halobellus sp. EA9]|uniref:hypothetical protein n=1 Tax=Halobellus sp. EA9 TaxID=3421647 RepID=UPI003EBFDAF5
MDRERVAAATEVLGVTLALIAGVGLVAVADSGAVLDDPADLRVLLTIGVGAGLFLLGVALESLGGEKRA